MNTSNRAGPESQGGWGSEPPSVADWEAQLGASRSGPFGPTLPLLVREAAVVVLFVDGHTAEEIAVVLGFSGETVRAYLVRVRLKYKNAGRAAAGTLALRSRLIEDGYLEG